VQFTGSLEIDLAFGWRCGVSGRGRQLYGVAVTEVFYRYTEEQDAENECDELYLVPGKPHSFVRPSIRRGIRG
jgi:hypothetical protein